MIDLSSFAGLLVVLRVGVISPAIDAALSCLQRHYQGSVVCNHPVLGESAIE